jgi:peptidoglycan/LPS O-acetylase OafA/YrhL
MLQTRAPVQTRHRALDGVRGVAVLAVLFFHCDVSWAPGGYLGVDVFFVLSGFLITSLLLAELDRSDRIDLVRFWRRRVTRLLPALAILVGLVVAFSSFIGLRESPPALRDDALATLGQFVNWRLIDTVGTTLVGSVRSPFQHCWSLAIEMQFYLVWPLVVALVASRFGPAHRRWLVGAVAAALAISSAIAMDVLVGTGSHTQRSYYGTDTRAQALLVGAVLATIVGRRLTGRAHPMSKSAATALATAGAVGATAVAAAFVYAPTSGHTMYDGWYLVFAGAAAVVLARLVLVPDGALPALLSSRPIVGLGRISYSLYLWHWPLLLVITEERTGLHGVNLFAARVAASLAVATLSYVLVEQRLGSRARADRPRSTTGGRRFRQSALAKTEAGPVTLAGAPVFVGDRL